MFASSAFAETVYKTVDREGNAVFSDTKTDGAEIIKIQKAQTVDSPEISSSKYIKKENKPIEPNYTSLEITNPLNDATIHSGSGDFSVNIDLQAELKENDTIVLFLDGKQVQSGRALNFFLTNLDRGTHTIDVAVINEEDVVMIRSSKVTFHLRRMSRLFPNFPKDPPAAQ